MALITCRDLCLAYEGDPAVIENLNIEVKEGDYLCILGENGSGKSTLLKGLLGLKAPSSGEIILGDGLKQSEIGYLPQQSSVQREFPASVYEVVLSGCLNQTGFFSFYRKEHKELVDKNMELLDIKDLKKRCYKDLSGGQQQRVLTEDQVEIMRQIAEFVINDGAISVKELNEIDTDLWRKGVTSFGGKALAEEMQALSKFLLKVA